MKNAENKIFSLLLGSIAFIFVFSINWAVNLISTSFIRGLIAFILFFVLGYVMYYFLFYQKPDHSNRIKGVEYIIDEEQGNMDLDEIYQTSKNNNLGSTASNFERLEFEKINVKEYK